MSRRRRFGTADWIRLIVDGLALAAGLVLLVRAGADADTAWAAAHHLPAGVIAVLGGIVAVTALLHLGPMRFAFPGLGARQSFVLAQSNFALSNLVPAGGAVALAVCWEMLRSWGLRTSRSVSGLAVVAGLTMIVVFLTMAGAVGLLAASGHLDSGLAPWIAWIVGVVVVAGLAAGGIALTVRGRHLRWFARVVGPGGRRWISSAAPMVREMGRWRRDALAVLSSSWPGVGGLLILIYLSQFALLQVILVTLQVQRGQPVTWIVEVFAVYAVARGVALLPVSPGGLGLVDATLVVALGWIGVSPDVAVTSVVLWRFGELIPQAAIGCGTLAVWRASSRRPGPAIGTGEPWLGRVVHRLTFTVLRLGPWRDQASGRAFDRVHRHTDPWNYTGSDYELVKSAAIAALTTDVAPATILEVGASTGHLALRLLHAHPAARLIAVDVSPAAVEQARTALAAERHRVRIVCTDIEGITLDEPVDLIVMSEVLYYLGGRRAVTRSLRGLAALVRPGTTVVLAHPPADAARLHPAALAALHMSSILECCIGSRQRPVQVTVGRRASATDGDEQQVQLPTR